MVFHRNGRRIKDIRGSWERTCREAGLSGRIPYDFRRTAIRNMVRAGIPEQVAMQISGHKTMVCFTRYNSFREPDLIAAADRFNTYLTLAHKPKKPTETANAVTA